MINLLCVIDMTWLGAILSGIAALLVAFISLITFLTERRDKRRREEYEEHNNILRKIESENKQQTEKLNSICDDVDQLHKNLDELSDKVDTNEKDRLRWQIRNFSKELRAGYTPQLDEFNEIENDFERYEKLGGNGFVKNEIKFIMSKKEEFYDK